MKKRYGWITAIGLCCVVAAIFAFFSNRIPGGAVMIQKLRGKSTVSDRLAQFGPVARSRWQPYFSQQRVTYPPQKLLLVGFKNEKQLQVYAGDENENFKLIRAFPILGSSGKLGPKLRYGDYQVPEGFYRIESLNPNSAFHLSLRVNYPNAFDKSQAQKDGRLELGGDIMIHGSNASVGCLAMGDEAAEDLFILAAEVGRQNINVILSPVDFRESDVPKDSKRPEWVKDLYAQIKAELVKLPGR